jgi:hypothetical protein
MNSEIQRLLFRLVRIERGSEKCFDFGGSLEPLRQPLGITPCLLAFPRLFLSCHVAAYHNGNTRVGSSQIDTNHISSIVRLEPHGTTTEASKT